MKNRRGQSSRHSYIDMTQCFHPILSRPDFYRRLRYFTGSAIPGNL